VADSISKQVCAATVFYFIVQVRPKFAAHYRIFLFDTIGFCALIFDGSAVWLASPENPIMVTWSPVGNTEGGCVATAIVFLGEIIHSLY
jgi:hypothetical protein